VNLCLVFFTVQSVEVNFWFEYLKQPPSLQSILINAVKNNDGFPVAGVNPVLPIVMTGWGAQSGLVLLVKIPPGQYSGTLNFTLQLSA